MEPFHWDNKYVTGLEAIDAQHHHLVDIINQYCDLLTNNSLKKSVVDETFNELASYAIYHFQEEEVLMKAVSIDSRHYNEHKNEHDDFLKDVSARYSNIDPEDKSATESLLSYLSTWLIVHILGSDQNMARQIHAINSGADPSEAYANEEHEQSSSTSTLLSALHGLIKQLSERNLELLNLNQTLEEKVEKRTHQLAEANKQLEVIALTDVLTNLPNRRHAMQYMELLWKESTNSGKPITCMMVDADNFKQINDNNGHDAGDIVLKELARALKNSVRNDDIASRLGGDEFFLICPNTDHSGGMYLAEKIREIVSKLEVHAGDGVWKGSISIGVATRNDKMNKLDDLVKAADDGVYLAKEAGKNCVRSIDN